MKKIELSELIARLISETLNEFVLNHQKLYKPKRRHIDKYRNSKYHPDEITRQKKIGAIQQTCQPKKQLVNQTSLLMR